MKQYNTCCMEEDESNQAFIYSAYITTRNGRRIYARAYGLTAFRFKANKCK